MKIRLKTTETGHNSFRVPTLVLRKHMYIRFSLFLIYVLVLSCRLYPRARIYLTKTNTIIVMRYPIIVFWPGGVSSVRLRIALPTHASTSDTETNSYERRYDNTGCCFNNRHLSIVTRVFGRKHAPSWHYINIRIIVVTIIIIITVVE